MQVIDQILNQTLHTRTTFETKLRALRAIASQKIGNSAFPMPMQSMVSDLKDMTIKEARAFMQAGSHPPAAVTAQGGFITPARHSTQVGTVESPGKTAT